MLKPVVSYVGTIKDIDNRKNLILVTDQFEVDWVLDYLGYTADEDDDPLDFSGLFVTIGDGDYEEVFSFEECIPFLDLRSHASRIEPYKILVIKLMGS